MPSSPGPRRARHPAARAAIARAATLGAATATALTLTACGGSTQRATTPAHPSGAAIAAAQTRRLGATVANHVAAVQDAAAEALARTAETAAETVADTNGGDDSSVTRSALAAQYPELTARAAGRPYLSAVTAAAGGYTLVVTSVSGDTFSVEQNASGPASLRCTGAASSACADGFWR